MEPVSLSVSVVALATVLDSALNCFKHVKVAKSVGSDYQIRVLRLQNLQLHPPRCGETVGLRKDPTAHEQSAASPLPETQLKRAELRRTCWPHHPTLLRRRRSGEQIRRRARRLGPHRRKLPKSGRHREALREDARHLPATPAADKGCEEGQVVAVLEGGTSVEIVDNIQKLIDDLENVSPAEARVSKEADLCEHGAGEMRNEKALPEFQQIALTQDAWLADAIGKLVQNVKIFLLQMARSKS